jgi:hypothetical protein
LLDGIIKMGGGRCDVVISKATFSHLDEGGNLHSVEDVCMVSIPLDAEWDRTNEVLCVLYGEKVKKEKK